MNRSNEIFENLFVLEAANNHWGSVERGLKIIRDHAQIVRFNNVKAAIKLQFRDVDAFIHPEFKGNQENRYIKKTEATKMSKEDFATMIAEHGMTRRFGMVTSASPIARP